MADYGPVGYGKAGSFEGFCSGSGIAEIGKMLAMEKLQGGEKTEFCNSSALFFCIHNLVYPAFFSDPFCFSTGLRNLLLYFFTVRLRCAMVQPMATEACYAVI